MYDNVLSFFYLLSGFLFIYRHLFVVILRKTLNAQLMTTISFISHVFEIVYLWFSIFKSTSKLIKTC